MAIQISKFRRPGIYIQEINKTTQITPVQDTLINLVIGFSKKGPINRPVLVNSYQEFVSIFGDIDRTLEKKGNYFHRTIQQVINQSPIWALNLLKTDDELDLLQWQSVSLSSSVENSSIFSDPYSSFFDKNEFWLRDTEAFQFNVDKTQPTEKTKILSFTNMSDKPISVFIYKSDISGFDIKAEDWYGGRDKVPSWMYFDDLISDYMIDVVVVSGYWNDYKSLSVDPKWSRYFNSKGLIKDQLNNFVNDPSVNTLKNYTVSLIPYFRDQNGTDYYVETVINNDTDYTGLFVTYDVDALETDNPNGLIDLIGHTLVGNETDHINFMSYNEVITETVSFEQKALVSPGNTLAFNTTIEYNNEVQHNGFFETTWIVSPIFDVLPSSDPAQNKVSLITLTNEARIVLNGSDLHIASGQEIGIPDVSENRIRKDTIYIDSKGQLGVMTGVEVSDWTEWEVVPTLSISDVLYPIAIVKVGTQRTQSTATDELYLGVTDVNDIEFLDNLTWKIVSSGDHGTAGSEEVDILVDYISSYEVLVTFNNTRVSDADNNYTKFRALKMFNDIRSNVAVGKTVVKLLDGTLAEIIDVSYTTDNNLNKDIKITVPTTNVIADNFELYYANDAFTLGEIGMRAVENVPDYGIVSKSSTFYQHYYDGIIKSGDYFLQNIIPNGSGINAIEFTKDDLGQSIIVMYTRDGAPDGEYSGPLSNIPELDAQGGDKIYVQDVDNNTGTYTLLSVAYEMGQYTKLGVTYDYKATFIVNEAVNEYVQYNKLVHIFDGNPDQYVYLKMYSIQSELYVDFVNSPDLETAGEQRIDPENNKTIWVFSDRSNFAQTVEIEAVLEQNQFLIDANRYGEIVVGDFLEAAIPNDLPIGYVPKKLTRINSRQIWEADPSLAVISTDAAVAYFDADPSTNIDIQVVRRNSVDNYVNTLQALVFDGFTMRLDSMPDGTEKRQNEILNLFAPGTPLFKGLTNRNQISWRYLIDSWGLGLTNNSKQQMVDLCGARLNALGLLNMPSAKAFKHSTNPTFINNDGTLNYEYIKLGGNPQSNPAFRYTFGQGQGQSNVAYFFPYVSIYDNGRTLNVPPAMFVANTFMNKHNSRRGDVYPWTIAAGVTNGLVTGFGATEVDIDGDDISELNEMGANPITFKLNRGYNIETNNTASIVPKSALSNIHVREVLIELENEMYNMLLTYQWRFNTAEVRSEIKQRADAICARFVAQDGLYDYLNVMDETNNTPDVIDAGIGVIDTYVEPIKGMGIIVNNITILRTGTIQSGGFTLQQ